MSLNPLSDVIDGAFELGVAAIKGIWGDKDKQAEEIRKLEEVKERGDAVEINAHVQLMLGQMAINKAEASHPSRFISGWRPALGWLGVVAFAYNIIVYNLLVWSFTLMQVFDAIPYYRVVKLMEGGQLVDKLINIIPPSPMDAAPLFVIVTAMIGVGAQRSYDKRHGTDTKRIT